ncbi:UNVERIFIED_CONTAM: putative acyl-activating enzyme 10 [Sesamum radiatum]|uniref:Acyl-activating enzyme 10 n=1 Tax=Sesamum radiatum TaxID=300843 RepID=A0AAW2V3Y9_SESRA
MYPLRQTHASSSLLSSSSAFHEKLAAPWRKSCPPSTNYFQSSAKKSTIIKASLSLPLSNSSSTLPLTPETETAKKVQPRSAANACPLTPMDFLERAAVVYGDCPSILYNETSRTWAETHTRCLKLASSIVSLGIKKGDVVSVVAPNVPAMCELHFSVPMAGAVLNNINLRLDANAISNILQHGGSKLVFVDFQSASVVEEAVSMFPSGLSRPVLVFIDDHYENHVNGSSAVKINGSHRLDYEEMVGNGDPAFKWIRPHSEWEPITLNYTSGTTSSPKGVVSSHRGAFLVSVTSLLEWAVSKQPVYLWTLPMFHANGWGYAWGMAAVGGANVCLRRVDAPSIYQALQR